MSQNSRLLAIRIEEKKLSDYICDTLKNKPLTPMFHFKFLQWLDLIHEWRDIDNGLTKV